VEVGVGHVQSIKSVGGAADARVTIDLDRQVQFTAFRLDRPERICLDLRNTRFSSGVHSQTIAGPTLRGIRSSQFEQNVVRVVLDLNTPAAYTVQFYADPPRLVIELSSGRPQPQRTPAVATAAQVARSAAGAAELIIALDPGHGGDDLGAVGQQGLEEKQLVLDVALRLGVLLKSQLGAKVIYTRRDDRPVPLEQRATAANQAGANLLISIHANGSNDPSAHGVETYSLDAAAANREARLAQPASPGRHALSSAERLRESRLFAQRVQESLYTGLRSDHVQNRGVRSAPLAVLREAQMPAILVEISFLSSPQEEHRLLTDEYRQQIAEALLSGIRRQVAAAVNNDPARKSALVQLP
jgi:N-acetylmuramoyl-L-alanine amidase